jgi:hypothetical protein
MAKEAGSAPDVASKTPGRASDVADSDSDYSDVEDLDLELSDDAESVSEQHSSKSNKKKPKRKATIVDKVRGLIWFLCWL